MPNEHPPLSLTEVHRDAVKDANSSWSETDKLYVSVCSALVGLAAIYGWDKPWSKVSTTFVGVLLLWLALNWALLINRYRKKICRSLEALSRVQDDPEFREHFCAEQKRFRDDWWLDYLIVLIVSFMSLCLFGLATASRWLDTGSISE